ncbi:hypothetical protein Ancab_036282 [Ancistrocladus abbreviatus]
MLFGDDSDVCIEYDLRMGQGMATLIEKPVPVFESTEPMALFKVGRVGHVAEKSLNRIEHQKALVQQLSSELLQAEPERTRLNTACFAESLPQDSVPFRESPDSPSKNHRNAQVVP